jgi:hypothetical protein
MAPSLRERGFGNRTTRSWSAVVGCVVARAVCAWRRDGEKAEIRLRRVASAIAFRRVLSGGPKTRVTATAQRVYGLKSW